MKINNRPKNDDDRSQRPRRPAVGGAGAGGKMQVIGEKDPNYVYRFETDEGSAIETMKGHGYEIVEEDDVQISSTNPVQSGSTQSVVVDRKSGAKGILMRQKKDYHEEDKQLRAEMIDKSEESMFRNLKTTEGRYGEVESTNSLAKESD